MSNYVLYEITGPLGNAEQELEDVLDMLTPEQAKDDNIGGVIASVLHEIEQARTEAQHHNCRECVIEDSDNGIETYVYGLHRLVIAQYGEVPKDGEDGFITNLREAVIAGKDLLRHGDASAEARVRTHTSQALRFQ